MNLNVHVDPPEFLIIGAMKAATTTLYDYISRHHQVLPAVYKELHYFSIYYDRGASWYLSHFYGHRYNEKGSKLITGEASGTYMPHPEAAVRAKQLSSDFKIIALLRDPVDRALSQYRHQFQNAKIENRPITEVFSEENINLQNEYLSHSVYYNQLQHWFDKFSRNQIHILFFEEFTKNTTRKLSDVFDFLELDPVHMRPGIRQMSTKKNKDKSIDIEKMRSLFEIPNEKLAELINLDLPWGKKRGSILKFKH